jgi:NAD kinase
MVLTFVAPHTLHVRPLVVPGGADVTITNRSSEVATEVIADGHAVGRLEPGATAGVRLGKQRSLLATLPEVTFFTRYASTFGRS